MAGRDSTQQPLVAERRYPSGNGPAPTPRTRAGGGGTGRGGGGGNGGSGNGGTGRGAAGNGGGRGGKGSDNKGRSNASKRRTTTARKRPRGPLGWVMAALAGMARFLWRIVWGIGWRIALMVFLVLGAAVGYYAVQMPPITEIVDGRARGSVTMLDRDGQVFAWRGEQFGGMISADQVSPYLRNAVIATEDRRFWYHIGIDPQGIASAIRINMSEGRGPLQGHGGSTITQQTAKLLCLGTPYVPADWESEAAYEADCRRSTIGRKVTEMLYAMAMEVAYSKEEILTIYLNRAYLGAGSRGFEAAAQRYFGHSAAQVTPAEAAMLAGLLQAPSTYAPTANLARAQGRANVVVGLMETQGYLSANEATEARTNPAQLSQAAAAQAGGYFADWVMESGPEFFTRSTTEDVIIRTSLDQRIQRAAERALFNVFDTQVREGSEAQAAIIVMSADGAVRAMVGGRDTRTSGAFNRATQALRQTGSAFKPFVFAAALDMGMSGYDIVDDSPLTIQVPGSGPWSPRNYDNNFKGPITLVQALAESRNIPAVRISENAGRDAVRAVAEGFGIASDIAAGPALALGSSEATLVEMTGAYAGILNGGSSVTPYGLISLSLQGDPNTIMDQGGGIGERVIRESAARELTWMMSRVIEEGTGQRARISGHELAGKSGTTSAARDAWFIGFSGEYVTGVWMGYDNNTPLNGVTGGGLPAEIWRQTMEGVLAGQPSVPLPMTPSAGTGNFVDPNGMEAEMIDTGTTDPALDAALREAFGPPGGGDSSADAILNALDAILGGGN